MSPNKAMTKKNKELLPAPSCSALCGNKAQGQLKLTEEISLPICDSCRDKIDPRREWVFVSFG
ncbi:MAG: hypothetical protein ACJ72J_08765 [Nitrososphaeraceae archaeon]